MKITVKELTVKIHTNGSEISEQRHSKMGHQIKLYITAIKVIKFTVANSNKKVISDINDIINKVRKNMNQK